MLPRDSVGSVGPAHGHDTLCATTSGLKPEKARTCQVGGYASIFPTMLEPQPERERSVLAAMVGCPVSAMATESPVIADELKTEPNVPRKSR
jgi:hypothetical protein